MMMNKTTKTKTKTMVKLRDRRRSARAVFGKKIVSFRNVKFLSFLFFIIVDFFVASSFAAVTPIPSASWHAFVEACLTEAPVTGECTTWDANNANNYGTMPNWNTSLVEDMSASYYGRTFNGDISNWDTAQVTNMENMFSSASAFNQNISNWDTAQVTNMANMFLPLLRSTKTSEVGIQRK